LFVSIPTENVYRRLFALCLGWAIAVEERDWKYRLSIYYTKPQDSGVFTCATPRGLTNSITVHVAGKSSTSSKNFIFIKPWFGFRSLVCINQGVRDAM